MKVLNIGGAGLAGAALAAVAASAKRASDAVAGKVKATTKRAKAIVAPKTWPHNHLHVNPHYRERQGGLMYFYVGGTIGGRHSKVTAQDVGRWMPHNGAREMARRVRQMDRAHGAA